MDTTETIDTSASEADSLRSLGQAADEGRDVSSTPNPEPRATGDDVTPTDTTSPDPKTDDESSETPEKDPAKEPQSKDTDTPKKELTPYEKAKARQDKTWQEINARKAQADRREQELAQREARIQQAERDRQPKQAADPVKDARGFTAEDYEQYAEKCIDDGEADMAKAAYAKARDLRQQEAVAAAGAPTKEQQDRIASDWRADMDAHLKADPELTKADSPIAKQLSALFEAEPWLERIPQGFSKALGVAKVQLQAGQAAGLQEDNKKLRAENARLTKLTSVNGGGPSGPPRQKRFDELSESEMGAELQRAAAQADGF